MGDGNLTQEIDYPGPSLANRETDSWYDWRDRLVAQKSGVQLNENDPVTVNRPIIVSTYDNLNEVTETQQYLGDGVTPTISNGALSPLAANSLRAQEIDSYDDQGRVYETQVYDVNPTNGNFPTTTLTTNYYRDLRGDVIAESDPGGLWTKSQYDGAGRDVMDYTTDGKGGTSWGAAGSVSGDTVLEQSQTVYDKDGNVIETIDSQRFDSVTGLGALGNPTSGIGARVSYTASYYDNADRLTASVDVGTNHGSAWTPPGTVPNSSPTVLVTTYGYNSMGLVQDVIDPQGIKTRTLYDNLGRTIETIQNYTNGTETANSNIGTVYGYDGNGNVIDVQADEPGGSYQQTNYVYGVTTADGNGVNSNDLLAATQYPDPTTGNPSTAQQVALTGAPTGGTFTLTFRGQTTTSLAYNAAAATVQSALAALSTIGSGNVQVSGSAGGPWQVQFTGALAGTFTPTLTGNGSGLTGGTSPAVAITSQQVTSTYNALGDVVQSTDRGGNVHQYSYDVLGRETADAVTTLGAGVDGSVRRIQYAYDSQGNQYLITTYDAASGGNIVNQVEDVYNGLDQLTVEYQSHSGQVNTTSTPKVQYAYTELTAGNNSRLTSVTYPDKYVLDYNYNIGLDSNISRLSSLVEDSTKLTLESYKYLGLDTVVERDHPQISVNQTYIATQKGQTGDGGDQYVGLDRFGRVVDQNWYNTSTSQPTDDFQYGYDQDSDVLYKLNVVDKAMSELYQYDSLNQLLSYARGQLNSTDNGIVSGTQSDSQGWTANALGDFTSVTTNSTPQTRTSNQQNEVSSISGYGTIAYDANGNLTQDGNSNTLTYDAWNHLVSIDGGLDTYSYDGLGRVLDGTLGTDLYYSSSGQVLEEDVAGVKQAQNVWSPVYANAMVLRDQASVFESGNLDTRVYVEQDANWNVTALWDVKKGAVEQRYAYQPYGAVTYLNPDFSPASGDSYGVPYLWQGMMFDSSMNLYFSGDGLRVYSLLLMDWLQTDPSGESAGPNGYKAMGDAPTDEVDPSGLKPGDGFWSWDTLLFLVGLETDGAGGVKSLKPGIHEEWAKDTATDIMIAMPQTRVGALAGGAYGLAHQGLGNITDWRRGDSLRGISGTATRDWMLMGGFFQPFARFRAARSIFGGAAFGTGAREMIRGDVEQGSLDLLAGALMGPRPRGLGREMRVPLRVIRGELEPPKIYPADFMGPIEEGALRLPAPQAFRLNSVPVPKGYTRSYRAVSEAEYQDILATGRLQQGPNALEGKWFADSIEGAQAHGKAWYPDGKFRIVEVDIPDNAPSLFKDPNLDRRGPARYLHNNDLPSLQPRPLE